MQVPFDIVWYDLIHREIRDLCVGLISEHMEVCGRHFIRYIVHVPHVGEGRGHQHASLVEAYPFGLSQVGVHV